MIKQNLVEYKSEVPLENLKAMEKLEKARQQLVNKEATFESLAYARFLKGIENDATYRIGAFGTFSCRDSEVLIDWPFLEPLITQKE